MIKFMPWIAVAAVCLFLQCSFAAAAGPLKVFILVGQSNMQGHARLRAIDYISKDPKTAPMYHDIIGDDGKPRVYDHVWITYFSSGRGEDVYQKSGQLTTGFGASPDEIGPELTFGIYMYKQLNEPILIIKTAWGGKSLHTEFRPPSGVDREPKAEVGHSYKLMMQDVKQVLADPKKYCPEYDPKQGYEIAGFVWFQGWNDMVSQGIYPNRGKPGGYDLYTQLMGDFIRDVRKDLNTPKMPFVIGVLGVGGKLDLEHPNRYTPIHQGFRDAMAAAADAPEFKGNVTAVKTEECWDKLQEQADSKVGKIKGEIKKMKADGKKLSRDEESKLFDDMLAKELTPQEIDAYHGISNFGFHYMGSAKILGCIGKKFAEAMAPMVQKQ